MRAEPNRTRMSWFLSVMWSETVEVLGQVRSGTKKSVLVLVLQVWYCFVKLDLVTLVVIMILKDTATFQVLFIVSRSILSLEHHYCGDQQWRSLT